MLIGIDGGGSKTDLVLLDTNGEVRNRIVRGGCSVSELGAQASARRLTDYVSELLISSYGVRVIPVTALFAGLSGGGNADSAGQISTMLKEAFPNIRSVRTAGDTLTALYAGVGTRDGMVIIAGTGSSCYVRHDGQYSLIGGWGHLIDDAGSGFSLGKDALNAALRHLDGRGEETLLTRLVNEKLGKSVRTCIGELYAGGKRLIASFAPLVFEAALQGDPAANAILARTADELALLIRTGAKQIPQQPWHIALAGSLWKSEMLLEAVRSRLSGEYILLPISVPPVFGSALAAAEDAHIEITDAFRTRLLDGLKG